MDMSNASNTSGVDRYIESLLKGLTRIGTYEIIWLNLRNDPQLFIHKEETKEGYKKIIISLPEEQDPIISTQFWCEQYYRVVIEIISRYLSLYSVSLVHIHTLNLIDLALIMKEEYGCKIITHLHCIPWKGVLNLHKDLFQEQYQQYYKEKNYNRKIYMTNISEERSYLSADKVICVTECAKEFVHNIAQISKERIAVITNGMDDNYTEHNEHRELQKKGRRLLYVGALSESKGIFSILNAMDRLQKQGKTFELIAAGSVDSRTRNLIETKYSHLNIQLPGRVDFETLKEYYKWADIGCIASLQEQCSYVAIEMAMFGLPIITTAVDGLDEMFIDGVSALKVRTLFHRYIGLRVDEDQLVQTLIRLSENSSLRASLSIGTRKRYLSKFTLSRMIEETCKVYEEVMQ